MTRWTHALRRPGPHPDRCDVNVGEDRICGCDRPTEPDSLSDARCHGCRHEVVPVFSVRPSDVPRPPR